MTLLRSTRDMSIKWIGRASLSKHKLRLFSCEWNDSHYDFDPKIDDNYSVAITRYLWRNRISISLIPSLIKVNINTAIDWDITVFGLRLHFTRFVIKRKEL